MSCAQTCTQARPAGRHTEAEPEPGPGTELAAGAAAPMSCDQLDEWSRDECAICLEALELAAAGAADVSADVRTLACRHRFHAQCIEITIDIASRRIVLRTAGTLSIGRCIGDWIRREHVCPLCNHEI